MSVDQQGKFYLVTCITIIVEKIYIINTVEESFSNMFQNCCFFEAILKFCTMKRSFGFVVDCCQLIITRFIESRGRSLSNINFFLGYEIKIS